MVRQLPRLDDDYAFNVNIKKNLIYKSVYLHGFFRKSVVRAWLAQLVAVYIHSNVPQESIEYFMFQKLGAYSEAIRLIFPSMNPDTETPILLCGDLNIVTQSK
jgi:hypothetical protein